MSDTGAGANFNNLIDALPFGVRVLYDNGELLYANQAFLNVSGCGSVEELQSLPNLGAEERQSLEWIYKESERLNRWNQGFHCRPYGLQSSKAKCNASERSASDSRQLISLTSHAISLPSISTRLFRKPIIW